ncbi:DedA family protein [Thermovibrio sp.]
MELSLLHSFFEKSVEFIKLHPNLACGVIFLWAFLENALLLGLILPAEKLLIVASVLVSKGVISPLNFLFCGTLGTFLGYTASYFMGSFLEEDFLRLLFKKLKLKEEDYKRVKKFVETKGELSLIFGRFLPVIRPTLPVVIGLFKPSFLKFTLFNFVGALLWISSYLLFGNLIGSSLSFIISHWKVSLFLLLLSFTLYLLWRSYGKDKKVL